MIIKNVSSGIITIDDIPGPQSGEGLEIQPGATITIFNDQAQESAQLGSFLASGALVNQGFSEPSAGTPVDIPASRVVAAKDALAVAANSAAPVSLIAAVAASGLYRVNAYVVCTHTGTGDTVPNLVVNYSDETGGNAVYANMPANPNATLLGATTQVMYLAAGSAVTYSVSGGTFTNGSKYDIHVAIEAI
jgi:hypothetical protein